MNAVSHDILKIQRVDGSFLYDAFELSFNNVDKTIILTRNNVDIWQSINKKAVSNNVHHTVDDDLNCSSLIGAAPSVLTTSVELATALGNACNYATPLHNQINNKSDKTTTCFFLTKTTNRRWCSWIYFTSCDR